MRECACLPLLYPVHSQEDACPHNQEDGSEAGEDRTYQSCYQFFGKTPLVLRFVDQVAKKYRNNHLVSIKKRKLNSYALKSLLKTYIINQLMIMKATKSRLPERRPNCLGLTGD